MLRTPPTNYSEQIIHHIHVIHLCAHPLSGCKNVLPFIRWVYHSYKLTQSVIVPHIMITAPVAHMVATASSMPIILSAIAEESSLHPVLGFSLMCLVCHSGQDWLVVVSQAICLSWNTLGWLLQIVAAGHRRTGKVPLVRPNLLPRCWRWVLSLSLICTISPRSVSSPKAAAIKEIPEASAFHCFISLYWGCYLRWPESELWWTDRKEMKDVNKCKPLRQHLSALSSPPKAPLIFHSSETQILVTATSPIASFSEPF